MNTYIYSGRVTRSVAKLVAADEGAKKRKNDEPEKRGKGGKKRRSEEENIEAEDEVPEVEAKKKKVVQREVVEEEPKPKARSRLRKVSHFINNYTLSFSNHFVLARFHHWGDFRRYLPTYFHTLSYLH